MNLKFFEITQLARLPEKEFGRQCDVTFNNYELEITMRIPTEMVELNRCDYEIQIGNDPHGYEFVEYSYNEKYGTHTYSFCFQQGEKDEHCISITAKKKLEFSLFDYYTFTVM